jgi:predicted transcriptional regulator
MRKPVSLNIRLNRNFAHANDSGAMKLEDWLKLTKMRKFEFAKRIGVQPSVVTDYCKGKYCPRPRVAEAIIRETGGAVTANDFLSIGPDHDARETEAVR